MPYRYYAPEIKVLVVRWKLTGLSDQEIRRRLRKSISHRSICRWLDLYELTHAVICDPYQYRARGRQRLLNNEDRNFIEALVESHPALFVSEIREKLYDEQGKMPSHSTIQIELRARLLLTIKKAGVSNVRKSLVAKYRWMQDWLDVPANFLVFTDESSICARDLLRIRHRSKRGTRSTRYVPRMDRHRHSILPAISFHGLLSLSVLEGSVNRLRFTNFLKYNLLPRMNRYPGPNSVLVLDNASIHHGGQIGSLCEKKGVLLVYLPPYCPELNPIELGFGVMKTHLRHTQALISAQDPVDVIKKAANKTFTPQLSHKLYMRCGYRYR